MSKFEISVEAVDDIPETLVEHPTRLEDKNRKGSRTSFLDPAISGLRRLSHIIIGQRGEYEVYIRLVLV